jgi:2,3-bisphosphoglycerate-independent phosphoglycerate mutase
LAALGIDFDLQRNDVAARGNFCTVDEEFNVTDRRAGRISTEQNQKLCERLQEIEMPSDVDVFVKTVKEHRLLLVFRGPNLSGAVSDTDPQETGVPPKECTSSSHESEKTAWLVNQFVQQAREALTDEDTANMILLRGFSQLPSWPSLPEVTKLKPAAIAAYPMYKGVAKLAGMDSLANGGALVEQIEVLENNWGDYDFFYLHVKPIDAAGEDGDFDRKVALIEDFDQELSRLMNLEPDVVLVTGDHSTPARMKYHSWHPVPVILWSEVCRADEVTRFGERACVVGGLGPRYPAQDLLPLMLANAGRLEKFGA